MTSRRTFVIAEAGVNHNGSRDLACRLIEIAAQSGADAVKFQTFKADRMASRHAGKADYQQAATGSEEGQLELLRRLELDADAHRHLIEHARSNGIGFLSTPFDEESVDLLSGSLGLEVLKVPSGEITNAPLLLKIAATGRRVILSTGMSTLDDVELALGALVFGYLKRDGRPSPEAFRAAYAEGRGALTDRVTLLHCTTEYPAPFDEINLRAMDTLKTTFGLPVGLSDHSPGIAVAMAAVARGATVIEKHFTVDRNLPGPDHRASLEPAELKAMVDGIRQVELSLGDGLKTPTPSEAKNAAVARKSLVAACDIRAGEIFSPDNVVAKRPGTGISPMRYWEWIGRKAARDYRQDEVLD